MKSTNEITPEATSESPTFSVWFTEAFEALDVTPSEVARRIGVDNAKIYNIVNGKFKPGYDTTNQILNAYPRLNANWLLKGQKPILHSSGAQIIGTHIFKFVTLPLLSVSESLEFFNPTLMQNDTYPVIVNSESKDFSDCVVVEMTDSSMLPRYPSGMKLLARPIKVDDWDYLHSILVVVHYRTTLVVRRIKENELPVKGYLTLYADNTDSGYVLIKREDLKSIWRVTEIVGGLAE